MLVKKAELTTGEWIIIQAVWENEPCAATTVQEIIEEKTSWSYSTVKTMMDRMVDKGLLTTKRIRNLILYSSIITRKDAQSGEILRTMKRAFDGTLTPMMQFILNNQSLSAEELIQLEQMIKNTKEKTEKVN